MRKETIKDWIKKWNINRIVDFTFTEGMRFQASTGFTNKDAQEMKSPIIKELKSRLTPSIKTKLK